MSSEIDLLIQCGITKLRWTFEEKGKLIQSLASSMVMRSMASLDQFIAGLKTVNIVHECVTDHPKLFSLLFTMNEEIKFDADSLGNMCRFSFPPEGGNNKVAEEATAYWWEEMLANFDEKEAGFKIADLLQFITGARTPPPSGFSSKINIEFFAKEERGQRLPFTSTCALIFHLPRAIGSQEELQQLIAQSIALGVGYGNI